MLYSANAKRETLKLTKRLVDHYDTTANNHVFLDITQYLTHLAMTVLTRFPFFGIHSFIDIYCLLDFDPMNVLSLGTSKLLKEWRIIMLGDGE